jgi:hypothetical protein
VKRIVNLTRFERRIRCDTKGSMRVRRQALKNFTETDSPYEVPENVGDALFAGPRSGDPQSGPRQRVCSEGIGQRPAGRSPNCRSPDGYSDKLEWFVHAQPASRRPRQVGAKEGA